MQYDRDLRRGRHAAAIAAIVNAAAALHHATAGNWLIAVVAAGWTAACVLIMELFKAHQRTRDELKQVAAAMIAAGVLAPRSVTRNVVAPGAIDDPRLPPHSVN